MRTKIQELTDTIINELDAIENLDEKVECLNHIRSALHAHSPFHAEPVECVLWIKSDQIHANDYNPNVVASPEFHLLHTSIQRDGYTQPIVACNLAEVGESETEYWEVVDGFHRNRIGKEKSDVANRVCRYLPVTKLVKSREERIAATIRHNRARGTHQIRPMSDIVLELSRFGYRDDEICNMIGMDLDEVIRLKQITGLKEAFSNHEFSKSWEEFESKYYKNQEDSL